MVVILKKLKVLMVALMPVVTAIGQHAEIRGTVVEHTEQSPIEFSTVSVHNTLDSTLVSGVVSDSQGKFKVSNLKEGRYYLRIQFMGYESRVVDAPVLTSGGVIDLGKISLTAKSTLLQQVEITGEKAAAYHQVDKQVYHASQFQSAQGGTATDVIKNLPSVSVNSEGEITLRGSSSFMILLDGKPTQADPSVILNQLPASAVENIELITTPSSRYDPDGKSGIINIITKKGTTDGYYLQVNAQTGLPSVQDYGNEGRPVRFAGDVTTNYKTGKWNLSLSANYKREDIAGYRDGVADTYVDGVHTQFPSLGERSYTSHSYSLKANVNYQFNANNFIETGFYAGKRSQFRQADIVYHQARYDLSTGQVLNTMDYFNKNLRERKGDFMVFNADYSHMFRNKSTVTFSGLYEKTILGGPTENKDVDPEAPSVLYTHAVNDEKNPLDGARFKADYALPVSKNGKLEAGYQYRYLLHKGGFTYNELDIATGAWHVRGELSSKISLTRHIHSWYGLYSGEIGKLTYSAGLRLESVDRKLVDDTERVYKFKRINLFPSASLLYALNHDFKLKSGYSRRIVHNTSNMMNPFPARRHSEVLETGDPNLLPEYVDVIEAGMIKEFSQHSLFINFYHRNTRNIINRVNTVYNDSLLIRTYTSAGNARASGVEGGLDLKIAPWWSLFAGGNIYHYEIKGSVFNNRVKRTSVNYTFNANTTVKIKASLSLQLTVNYTSATVTAQGEDSEFLIPSITLKQTVLKGQGSVSLQWQNIDLGLLKTNEQRLTTAGDGFYTSTNYIQEVDIFRLNFSYQLNKLTRKLRFAESEFGEKEF